MPTISIVTAVVAGKHEHLGASYESLRGQDMPPGWEWQWVVQEDGDTTEPVAALPADPRISTGGAARGRPATARTMALSRVDGVLVRALDADDLLTAGALARDIETLTAHPKLGWCVSPAWDLMPDGTTKPGPRDPGSGPLTPGFLAEGEREGFLQVLGTTLCAYTQLVRALGGWQAIPADEDVALLLAAEAVADGWMIGEPGMLYRRWAGNSTEDIDKKVHAAKASPRRAVILNRIDALHDSGWRWAPTADVRAAMQRSAIA